MVVVLARTACPERVVVRRVSCGVEEKKSEGLSVMVLSLTLAAAVGAIQLIVPIYLVSHACKADHRFYRNAKGGMRNERRTDERRV